MRAATCSERSNPVRVWNLARFTLCHGHIFTWHRSPLHIGRTRASATVDAMTINQCRWPALQHVSCPAANASASDLHKIFTAHFTSCHLIEANDGSLRRNHSAYRETQPAVLRLVTQTDHFDAVRREQLACRFWKNIGKN